MKRARKVLLLAVLLLFIFLLFPPVVYAGKLYSFRDQAGLAIYKSPSCWVFGIGWAFWETPPRGQLAYNIYPPYHCNAGFAI